MQNFNRNGQKMMQTVQLGRELPSICKWLPQDKTAKCDKVRDGQQITFATLNRFCPLHKPPCP